MGPVGEKRDQALPGNLGEGHDAETGGAWLEWGTRYLETSDHIGNLPLLPDAEVGPSAKELEPHLGSLSPYGP